MFNLPNIFVTEVGERVMLHRYPTTSECQKLLRMNYLKRKCIRNFSNQKKSASG